MISNLNQLKSSQKKLYILYLIIITLFFISALLIDYNVYIKITLFVITILGDGIFIYQNKGDVKWILNDAFIFLLIFLGIFYWSR